MRSGRLPGHLEVTAVLLMTTWTNFLAVGTLAVAGLGTACDSGSTDEGPSCGYLDETECDATPECRTVAALKGGASEPEFVSCRSDDGACQAAVMCAHRFGETECYEFFSTCLPSGWIDMPCNRPECP